MILVRVAGLLVLLLMAGCASSSTVSTGPVAGSEEFVGTTPCDVRSREFLGEVSTNAPCHSITWHLTLLKNHPASAPSKYTLEAKYGLPGRNDPNQIEDGPTVKLEGTWEIVRSPAATPRRIIYRIHDKRGQALNLVRLGEHLLHCSDSNNQLMIGNGGWSYTLNRKGLAYEN